MLAMLLQRKMEILNQLEIIVGKQQQQQLISPQIKMVNVYPDHIMFLYIRTNFIIFYHCFVRACLCVTYLIYSMFYIFCIYFCT